MKKSATSLTKQELYETGWATIGGRAEDFATILDRDGSKAAWDAIEETYANETPDVFRGIVVLAQFGPDAYYNREILKG